MGGEHDEPGQQIFKWATQGGMSRFSEFADLSKHQLEQLATLGDTVEPGSSEFEEIMQYFFDYQEGMGKLGGGEANISSLERELGQLERGVTGPGGLTQQKGTFADILQQKIGTRRQSYVPQEKTSRYGQVTGTGGGVDPTSSYLSGVGSDVSAYGTSITGIDKSIYDILYGTGTGSIHDIYGQYGLEVGKSLAGTDGGMWYEG